MLIVVCQLTTQPVETRTVQLFPCLVYLLLVSVSMGSRDLSILGLCLHLSFRLKTFPKYAFLYKVGQILELLC